MIPLHYVTDLNKVNNQKKVFFAILRFFFYFQGWQVCLRQIATAFNLRTWDSDIRIGIISSVTESKKIVCDLPFENQLFGYFHYCTEIPEININLLPNTCNFHRKIRFIFSLRLSKNAQNVRFREAKFQSFPGEHAPGLPQCTRIFGAPYYFCRTNSELLPPGLLFPMGNTQYNITYLTYTKRCFFFQ